MARGRTIWKKLAAAFALAVIAVAALALWAWRHPLELYQLTSRRALERAGLERHEVDLAGGRLTFFRGGDGPDLVLLLHGAGDQAGAWAKVAPGLVGDYRLTALDLPGHGDSEPVAGPLPYSTVLAGLEAFLDTLDADRPVTLVGHSMGAWLAMVYAHRHPGRLARVVAVNGGAVRGAPSGVNLLPESREEARRTMAALRDPSSPEVPSFVLDDIVRRAAAGPLGRLMQELDDMESHLLDGRLGEIRVGVDLVWGESDRHLTLDYARRMERELPAARLWPVPRCGHLPPNECPERFLDVLRRVLAAAPPTG